MSRSNQNNSVFSVFSSLGWPLFLGSLLCMGFYALIINGVIRNNVIDRYFLGHTVQYIEAFLFFVGLSALFLRGLNVLGQFGVMSEIEIESPPPGGQPVSSAQDMVERLERFPNKVRRSYLLTRLSTIFEFVMRKGSSDGLDDELKHQSELDSVRQNNGYALVRMIVWATPMLGFLGTVIGITLALGELSPKSLVATPEQAMDGLLAGLQVAFDTTAVALGLSMILMFVQYVVNQMETQLLEAVDTRVDREMLGRFRKSVALDSVSDSDDPNVAALKSIGEAVLESVESSVDRQADLWKKSLLDSRDRWDEIMATAGTNIEDALESAFRRSIVSHAQELSRNEEDAQLRTERRWERLESVLTENARVMQTQQSELVRQGDLMLQAINAAGEVAKLQDALNENMRSLSLTGKFDETVMSLSAAINLLNARLSAPQDNAGRVKIYRGGESQGRVA